MGDEYHYLFVCPFFDEERKQYLPVSPNHPDVIHIISLFNNNENSQLSRLANFVELIMTIFKHRYEWEDGV